MKQIYLALSHGQALVRRREAYTHDAGYRTCDDCSGHCHEEQAANWFPAGINLFWPRFPCR